MDKVLDRLRAELDWLDRSIMPRPTGERSPWVLRAMSDRLVRNFPASGRIRLLGTQFAMSVLTDETIDRLRQRESDVFIGCEWIDVRGTSPTALSGRSYREPTANPPDAVVVLVPFVRDRTIARTLLAMAADQHPRVPLHLLAFGGVTAELGSLVREMDVAIGVYPTLHVGRVVQTPPSTWERLDPQPLATMEADLRSTPQIVATRMARGTCAIYGVDLAEAMG